MDEKLSKLKGQISKIEKLKNKEFLNIRKIKEK